MKTPITDDQTRHVFQWNDKSGRYVPAGTMVDANLARRLESDRAALMDALESFLNPSHPSRSNHTLLAVALANARANFPTT